MQAEAAMTLYVLFIFIAYPMLNYAIIGARCFFVWFACNQAVMAGSKAHTLVNSVQIGFPPVTYYGGLGIGWTKALQVLQAFGNVDKFGNPQPGNPGIYWDTKTYPQFTIRFVPIDPLAGLPLITYPPTPPGMSYNTSTTTSPIAKIPDQNQYITEFQAVINGQVWPLIPVPLIGNIPGLSGPMNIQVSSEAQFENPPGLTQ